MGCEVWKRRIEYSIDQNAKKFSYSDNRQVIIIYVQALLCLVIINLLPEGNCANLFQVPYAGAGFGD